MFVKGQGILSAVGKRCLFLLLFFLFKLALHWLVFGVCLDILSSRPFYDFLSDCCLFFMRFSVFEFLKTYFVRNQCK